MGSSSDQTPICDISEAEDDEDQLQKEFEQMNFKFQISEDRRYDLENFMSTEVCEVESSSCTSP